MPVFPPRLHVLLARDAPLGVVIRRGPSKSGCTLLWDRRGDTFKVGQWLRGRIYERRSDLSPDGKFFIYFAMNGKWQSETKGSWTAISRAPYLNALALFAKGDCWHGGGLFTGLKMFWLNDGWGHTPLRQAKLLHRDNHFTPATYYGGECLGVYYPRLLRDGWSLVERVEVGQWKDYTVFEKTAWAGWILRKIAHAEVGSPDGKGCYWDEHELVHAESGERIACPTWEWAEIDRKRLVWAAEGKLFSGKLKQAGLSDEKMLHDFSGMTFEAIKAPY